jgi:hypothetical protein
LDDIAEPNLPDKGRSLYAKGLETCLKYVYAIADKCADQERVGRLKDCLLHAFDDVATVAYARETAAQRK